LSFNLFVYKPIYVSLGHIKWLSPYQEDETPYSLNTQFFPINPPSQTTSRTFEEQCKKLENKIIVLDCGDHIEKTGFLQKVENKRIHLITADRGTAYWNLEHVKAIYLP
jgi:hypothetical protein